MITLLILLICIIGLAIFLIVGGLGFLLTFGDVIIGVTIVVLIIKAIIKKKKGA